MVTDTETLYLRKPLWAAQCFGYMLLTIFIICSLEGSISAGPPVRRPWLDPNTGEPFFSLGWYDWEEASVGAASGVASLEKGKKVLDQLAKMNTNLIVFYNTWANSEACETLSDNIPLMQQHLDRAYARGIKVITPERSYEAFKAYDATHIANA